MEEPTGRPVAVRSEESTITISIFSLAELRSGKARERRGNGFEEISFVASSFGYWPLGLS